MSLITPTDGETANSVTLAGPYHTLPLVSRAVAGEGLDCGARQKVSPNTVCRLIQWLMTRVSDKAPVLCHEYASGKCEVTNGDVCIYLQNCTNYQANELQPFTCLSRMIMWINDKATKFGCTYTNSVRVKRLIKQPAKPRQDCKCL